MKVQFIKVNKEAMVPQCSTKFSAGRDIAACIPTLERVIIHPGETVKIPSGLAVKIPDGYFGGVFARSGLSTKQGLRPATAVSVIDSDYVGEIFIPIHNDSNEIRVIEHGQRICQLVILPYLNAEFEEVDKLENTERGDNGFGSSGK